VEGVYKRLEKEPTVSWLSAAKYYLGPLIGEVGPRFFSEPSKGLTSAQCLILQNIIRNKEVYWDKADVGQRALIRSCVVEITSKNLLMFSTPLHRRFFFRRAYPNRACDRPTNINDWLVSVLEKFDPQALDLKESHGKRRDFPKERGILQDEFYRCAFQSIPPSCDLAAEVSQLTWKHAKISGSLDFWVDSGLDWAIELMRLGTSKTIDEHEDRIDGKYAPLDPTEARVVDFRLPGDVPVTGSDLFVAVVFHQGYLGADVHFYKGGSAVMKRVIKFGAWQAPTASVQIFRAAKEVEAIRVKEEATKRMEEANENEENDLNEDD